MPGIARDAGEDSAGGPIIEGSPNVAANNKPVARIGDAVEGHAPGGVHSSPTMAEGSPDVFTNNIQTSREGDKASCGDPSTGSENVFLNEPGEIIENLFLPDNPYQFVFAKPILIEAGSNAPNDDPESNVVDYKTTDTPPGPVDESKPADTTPAAVDQGSPVDCGSYKTDPIDYGQSLSTNFTIRSLSIGAVFAHNIVPQNGLTVGDIICNLKGLAENILEPLRVRYPGFRINSGFRKGTGTSQHNKGMACDLQWAGFSPGDYTPVAEWMRANLPFDQLIFEHGNSIWIHVSYNRTANKQRGAILTYYPKVSPNYKPGLTNYYA
jgi:uncharacterized Zn-binding protein involved in type VI secretion